MRGTGFASIVWRRCRLRRRDWYYGTRIGTLRQKSEAAQGAAGGQKPKRIEACRQHDDSGGAGHSDGRPRSPIIRIMLGPGIACAMAKMFVKS
jgi:hypothetical protein